MELLRRILFVLGLLAGAWTWLASRPVLVSVAVEDFARAKQRAEERPTGFLYRDDTLEEFHRQRTEGRTKRVDGDEWSAFHAAVAAATREGTGSPDLRARRGEDYYAERLYFLPDEPPLDAFMSLLGEDRPLVYVSIGDEGPTAPTLAVTRVETARVADQPPAWLLRPRRPWAMWLALGGLACYVLLPRRRAGPDAIRYARPSAIVVPDLLGAGLLVVFCALPLIVVTANGGSLFDLHDGWWVIGAVCWFLALAPLAILGVSTRNAAFQIEAREESLVVHRLTGRREIAYRDMEVLQPIEWRTPAWLRRFGRLLVLFTWRGGLPALMLEQGRGDGLDIILRDGPPERIWLSSLLGTERLIARLEGAGVAIPAEVRELADAPQRSSGRGAVHSTKTSRTTTPSGTTKDSARS